MHSSPDKSKTIADRLLNITPIAMLVIVLTTLGFANKFTLDARNLWTTFVPRSHVYAREITDEYYIWLGEFRKECDAIDLRREIVKLSLLSFQYQRKGDLAEQTRTPGEMLSSRVVIGFGPDQVIYSKASYDDDLWIVGLDLEEGQGDMLVTADELDKIMSRFTHIEKEYSSGNPLFDLASSLKKAF